MNSTVGRNMSSSECRRREVTARMWRAAEDCSRSERWRLEKLGRRRLRVGYEEQTDHETKRNADAFETRLCWMMKFIGEIWRCQAVKTFINTNTNITTNNNVLIFLFLVVLFLFVFQYFCLYIVCCLFCYCYYTLRWMKTINSAWWQRHVCV